MNDWQTSTTWLSFSKGSIILKRWSALSSRQAIRFPLSNWNRLSRSCARVEKLRSLQFDTDSVSGQTPVGTATLRIIEREPEKTIKFAAEGIPVAANMWIQLLPQSENECAMRLTVKADLNFFIRQMVGKKLEQGVDGLAQMLASLPY